MQKNDCIYISWDKISTDELIDIYYNNFNYDINHRRLLEDWAAEHEETARIRMIKEFESDFKKDELLKLDGLKNYAVLYPYVSFEYDGETIESVILTNEIETEFVPQNKWEYEFYFTPSNGKIYTAILNGGVDGSIKPILTSSVYIEIYNENHTRDERLWGNIITFN